jgi:hypothetical protein
VSSESPAAIAPELLGRLYETLGRPSLWPEVVAEMTAWTGGLIGGLQFRRLAPELSTKLISSGLEPEFHRAYVEHYYQHDPHLLKVGSLVAGETVRSRDVVPDEDFHGTTFFNEFCRPQGIRDLLGAMIIREPELAVSFAMFAPCARPFEAASHARLAALVPHLSRVLRLTLEREKTEVERAALGDAHVALGAGILRVDRTLRVHATLGAAAERLEAPTCAVAVVGGTLGSRCTADTERLCAAVRHAFEGSASRVCFGGTTVLVAPAAPSAGLVPDDTVNVILLPTSDLTPGGSAVLATLPPSLRPIALLMAEGRGDKEIAEQLGMSVATARTYATRLMKRLGVGGRRELMLLLR